MIALTISDLLDGSMACRRIAEMLGRRRDHSVPDALCIRNDSFTEEGFVGMVELVSELWDGALILDCEDPATISKAMIRLLDRRPIVVGANTTNLEQFCMISKMFGCPIVVAAETVEGLMDMAETATGFGASEIVLDPMVRNMKQCLETCTDLHRISEMMNGTDYRVMVRGWSGEYAMAVATVGLLCHASIVLVDDLDADCCETMNELMSSAL